MTRVTLCNVLLIVSLSAAGLGAAADETRLVEAVKAANASAVRALIQQHADVNATAADGTSPLHWAVDADDVATADLLIRAGANVKAANRYGVTPLSLACVNGNAAMIERLLKAGADPNTVFSEGETAVMTAARTGNAATVKTLLAHGADVNAKEKWRGQTALMWAAAEGHAETIKALVEAGADIKAHSNMGFSALLYAVREGQIGALRALLAAGASANETVPLETPPLGKALPATTANLANVQGQTSALVLAVMNAHYEVASVLLDAGADPNAAAQGWTALHEMTWTRRPHRGTIPGPTGSGAMDSLALVRKLATRGANLNAPITHEPQSGYRHKKLALNRLGATPFLMAARYGDVPLMRLLVELGADPHQPNDDGTTPLMVAAGVGVWSVGEDPGTESELLEATTLAWELGGDVNAVDDNGETAMHGAAYVGANSIVEFLVAKGAKVDVWNQKNQNGWTPLAIAEGVFRTTSFKDAPQTAALLRRLIGAAGASK